MSVVSRMVVSEVTHYATYSKVKLTAQYVADESDPHYEEIKEFFHATPSGSFEANITNAVAAEQFSPGDAYYLSLERIPRPGEADE